VVAPGAVGKSLPKAHADTGQDGQAGVRFCVSGYVKVVFGIFITNTVVSQILFLQAMTQEVTVPDGGVAGLTCGVKVIQPEAVGPEVAYPAGVPHEV
jgi:hypothetical protein